MKYRKQPFHWNLSIPNDRNLAQIFPELNGLQQITEQNDWHNDAPYQQSLRLFHWVKRLPDSLLQSINLPKSSLRSLLNSIKDPAHSHYTAQALLAFIALIHDVGKAETFQRLPDGTTRCPAHEAAGARLAPAICARFDFSPAETDLITTLVGAHGEPYALFKKIAALSALQQQEQIHRFEAEHADHLLPLLILACGDMITSHLRAIRPEKYEAVFDFYRRWLQNLCSKEE